ncbi:MAG: oligosaccharide flippase family protein [Sedimentisphaerales bacterium]|jgi:O-antigen/teichoic acid export membrane protein|nr:oligosaccharide flippase family protein [Sedimentisphaerales bacterium]
MYCPSLLRPFLARLGASPLGLRLASGTFWVMIGTATSRMLNLLAMVVVARLLGKSVFGELGMVRATVGMLGLFAGFSLGLTATKHVAEFKKKDPERAGRIIALSWTVSAVTGGTMAVVLVLLGPWLAKHTLNAPHLAPMLQIGAGIVFLNALNGAQTGALSGFEAFRTIAVVNFCVGIAGFPLLAFGAWIGNLGGALWALVANLGIHWLLNHLALRTEAHRQGVPLRISGCASELPILWSFSLPVVISGILTGPVMWSCRSLLAHQPDGYSALGTLAVAESWRIIPLFLCTMIAQANLPIMSQLYAEGRMRSLKKMLTAQFCLNGAIAVGGALSVSLLSKPIMRAYGSEFAADYPVLVPIMISTVPMQLTTVVGTLNRCIGKVWWNALFNAAWALVYMLSTILLVELKALGLAWAILIAYSFQFLLAAMYMFSLIQEHRSKAYKCLDDERGHSVQTAISTKTCMENL